ncbi:DUF4956 domain-containing protein [Nocardioides immobilis]|uniref:DUF4956 domain-containing protein n=2 Tax=Nocardioides immobilis TaxID=2049295 RepID=A0A417XUG5_9ACTN|nr:DUF4956 domain-containing protein [Nocardioides immobilis]
MLAADAVAIVVLVFGIFLRRGGRRELVVAFLVVNVGVLAVTVALAGGSVGAGLGLGLFGVLSIIRLRSEELAQREIAYYFAAIALGLLGGLSSVLEPVHLALMGAVLVAVWIGDHPLLARTTTVQDIVLDSAVTDDGLLAQRLEDLLGDSVVSFDVQRTDLVNDVTLVRVRRRATTDSKGIARSAVRRAGGAR